MNNQTKRLSTLSAAFLICSLLFISGCRSPEADKTPAPSPPVRTQKVEVMPEDSPEQSRRHVYDEIGRELELHISYRNKEQASTYFREDGTKSEVTVTKDNGKLKSRIVYGEDGQTVVEGKETRDDDTTLWTMESLPDGSVKKTTFWYDGNRKFSEEISSKNSYSLTYFRKGGSVWRKKSGTSAKNLKQEEHFDKNGKVTARVDWLSDKQKIVTIFNTDGSKDTSATYVLQQNQWGDSWQLTTIDDFTAGKLTRKIIIGENGYGPKEIQVFNDDGSKVVRQLRTDYPYNTLQEETFDKDGNSTGVTKFGPNGGGSGEYIDRSPFWRVESNDPYQIWDRQEKYPYYRNSNSSYYGYGYSEDDE
ncbi:MAG: hypothetical protein K2W82_11025 [Candidatus Obscuribacterales bacterium]|nr:hypothetical protein [Candidatus Obscuribacterales bacterium]